MASRVQLALRVPDLARMDHLGVEVDSTEAVQAAATGLSEAQGSTCCARPVETDIQESVVEGGCC